MTRYDREGHPRNTELLSFSCKLATNCSRPDAVVDHDAADITLNNVTAAFLSPVQDNTVGAA